MRSFLLSAIQEASDETPCRLIFLPSVRSPNSFWGFNSSSRQKGGGSFLVLYCLGLLLPFPLWLYQVRTWSVWFFFLEINFYNPSIYLSIYLSMCICWYLSVDYKHSIIYLSVFISVNLLFSISYLTICLSIYLSSYIYKRCNWIILNKGFYNFFAPIIPNKEAY